MLVPLTLDCVGCLHWWLEGERWLLGVSLQVSPPFLLLFTDACLTGWGAHLLDLTVAGVWSQEEKELPINVLKMKVVCLALDVSWTQGRGNRLSS